MKETLDQAGIGEIVDSNRGEYKVNPETFTCDYYDFLNGDKDAIEKFCGEYLSDYSWGEETNGMLFGMCPPDHRVFKREY